MKKFKDLRKKKELIAHLKGGFSRSYCSGGISKIVGVVKVKNGKTNIKGKNTGSFILLYGLAGQLNKNYKFNNLR
jgi:hypothetical protein